MQSDQPMPSTGDPIRLVFVPRGVADAEATTAYMTDLSGRVVAIDLGNGAEIWRSGVAGRPVLAAAGRLFVLAPPDRDVPGAPRLEVLDAASGRRTGGRAFQLAGAPSGPLDPSDLELSAALDGDVLRLEWRLPGGYTGGAPPPEHVRARYEAPASGVVEYEPDSERLAAEPVPEPRDEPPELPSWPYRRDDAWRRSAWPAGDGLARLVLDEARTPPVLVLELRDHRGEEQARATDLLEGRALEPTVTADGRHLFLRRTAPSDGRWHVFETESGQRLAELPYEEGSRLPAVLGDRVLYLVLPPRSPEGRAATMHAVRMPTARTLWTHPLDGPTAAEPPPLPG